MNIPQHELTAWLAEQPPEKLDAWREFADTFLRRFGSELAAAVRDPLAPTTIAWAAPGELTRAETQEYIEKLSASILIEDRVKGALAALGALRVLVGLVGGLA